MLATLAMTLPVIGPVKLPAMGPAPVMVGAVSVLFVSVWLAVY